MEVCSGCGAAAKFHPWVGVKLDEETGEAAAFPVCGACHLDPAHRQAPLKMHFFERAMESVALANAGKGDIG